MMEIADFTEKKCSSGKNIQFMPKRRVKIDLGKAVKLLEEKKALVEIETQPLLIFRLDGVQVDLNASGRTIVKTEERKKARKAFSQVLQAISASSLK